MITSSVLLALCYLAGSIPFGYLVARAKGLDIRTFGSGNIGATNVGRALGRRYGFGVFGLDFFKGFAPVLAVTAWGRHGEPTPFLLHDLPVLAALAAVMGHVFPVWLKFRGGKAGATGLGVGAVLSPWSMLVALVVWILLVLATRYVSLGTIVAAAAYLAAYLIFTSLASSPLDRENRTMAVFCVLVTILVIVRHRTNIERLWKGTEGKV